MIDSTRRHATLLALTAAALTWCGGCAHSGHDVVAREGAYDLQDRDTKQTVFTTNLAPGDRARISYMGYQPVRATVDRHYIAGADRGANTSANTNEVAGWQWLALDPDGRYAWHGEDKNRK